MPLWIGLFFTFCRNSPASQAVVLLMNLSIIGQNASSPQVAVDSIGNITAVWFRFDGKHLVVQASTKPYGPGGWQAVPDNISTPDQDAFNPHMTKISFGNVFVVWEQFDGKHFVVHSSIKSFGGKWQQTSDQLSQSGQNASNPQIATDSFGNAFAVWQRFNGTKTIIQSSKKSLRGRWQSIPDDLSLPDVNSKNPQIVIDSYDTATVVWQAAGERGEVIESSTRQFQEEWQTIPNTLCEPSLSNAFPRLGADLYCNVTAVWNQFDGDYGTPARLRGSGGSGTLAFLGAGVALGFTLLWRRRSFWWYAQLGIALLAAALVTVTGCGGSSHATPQGSYTINVTASSGSSSQTATYTLTVQ